MDISADVTAIVGQAPEWNFAGDCALLELMKRISQNLQESSERTTQKFDEFERNVRLADIALDNATNSLRSLQFGQQFVEYRVEEVDDDDFAMPEEQSTKPALPAKSSEEMASEFLNNNLQMFRKNFEPLTIEVPDSDDEEECAANQTTVFRAKNPYDAIPLPYIIGSKEWQEHKYAGLYDSAENSEDEQPEQFSSSSSDELEIVASKAIPKALASDSSSLSSLPKEPVMNVVAKQAPHPSPPQPAVRTKAQPRPIISSQRNPHERDLFSALRASPPSDDPPSTSSSLNSSPAISHRTAAVAGLPRKDASLSSSSSSVSKPMLAGRQSPPKLFDEPPPTPIVIPTPAPTPAREEVEVKPVAAASQIKRKPVNLFNDDEFNSFMSEIVDKVQSKSGGNQTPAKTLAKEPAKVIKAAPVEVQPVAKASKLNLFDDSPPLSPIVTPVHKPTQAAPTPAKTLPTSLFDDNLDDDDDFLSSFASRAKPASQVTRTSLFDDDDDDDLDIDDIFAKKPKVALPAQKPITKTSLFDDDKEDSMKDIFGAKKQDPMKSLQKEEQVAIQPKAIPKTSLFDDEEEESDVKDIFGASKPAIQPAMQQVKKTEQDVVIAPKTIAKTGLFDDEVQDDNVKDIFGAAAEQVKQEEQHVKQDVTIPPKTKAKIALFDDDEEEDNVKDIFGTKATEPSVKQQTEKKEKDVEIQTKAIPKSSLFDDGDDEDNMKDIFGGSAAKTTSQKQQVTIQPKIVSKPSLFDDDDEKEEDNVKDIFGATAKSEEQRKEQELPSSVQHKSLFDDLGDDDLFGTPKSNKNVFAADTEKRSEIMAVKEEPPEDDVLPEVPQKEHPEIEAAETSETKFKEIAIPKADLFSDDFSDEEPITKIVEATATSEIINKSKEIIENAEPTNIKEDVEFKDQTEEELLPEDVVLDDMLGKFADTRDAVQAAELLQDPIISVVADVSNKKPNNESQMPPPKSLDIAAAQKIMQNYSSLFSDEPPDDSEFFQTLGTSSLNSLSASKMFDNEHDFFEPSLPALPKSAEQPVEQSNSDYGGMRLFSDVPPEDDGEEQPAIAPVQRQSVPIADGVATKRIHTIFYDDFSETARATPEKKLEVQTKPRTEEQSKTQRETQTKSQSTKESADVVDRSVPSNSSDLKKPTSPVKKLQMPNININVKALLPGAGTLPKLPKKQQEEQVKEQTNNEVKDETIDRPKEQARHTVVKKQEKSSASSADAENILQCVGKTRARGPARRPSTRRARQESYAKSLQEQHEVETAPSSSPSTNIPSQQNSLERDDSIDKSKSAAPAKQTASFLESDDDADDALFGAVKKLPVVAPAATPVALLSTQPPEDEHKPVDKPHKVAASFLDSDDDDSGFLFSPPTATPAVASNIDGKSTTKSSALKQVSFLDSDEAERKVKAATVPPKSVQAAAKDVPSSTPVTAPVTAPVSVTNPLSVPAASSVGPTVTVQAQTVPSAAPTVALPKQQLAVKATTTSAALTNRPPTNFKSFLDSDDDDDTLFSSLPKPATIPPAAAPQAAKTKKAVKKVEEKLQMPTAASVATQKSEPQKPKASSSNKLFDDSDDDEDLFGGGNAKAATTVQPTKTKASLFDNSDSEKEAPPKALTTKVKLPTKPSKSLFSDDEDDDDLFGSGAGTKRAAIPSQAKPAQVAKRQPPKTSNKQSKPGKQQAKPLPSSGSGNSDNPLADLLGP
ncbi:WASH complex subunit 2 isoform X2 [Drosophila sulfurigaster albostrigata]|uniref:WASH complex subunit 2 isoform X2 n=1 Tax=Drosophila sulfurigaster albostrigata TaxID=89887 RepID=UPI002D21D857|nr:WASH complex subunit 2 isoform X2 [Drosophila sulfurigaster albostrigata]